MIDQYSRRMRSAAQAARVEFPESAGHREMSLRAAWITDAAGQEISTVSSGEPFQLHIRFTAHQPLASAEMFAEIIDSLGQKVTTLNTHVTSQYQSLSPGTWDWCCSVSELWLTEGDYFVNLAAKNLRTVCDEKPGCLSFTIEGSLAANARHAVGSTYGVVAPPHSWRLSTADREAPLATSDIAAATSAGPGGLH
jgi:hypothetical protein